MTKTNLNQVNLHNDVSGSGRDGKENDHRMPRARSLDDAPGD